MSKQITGNRYYFQDGTVSEFDDETKILHHEDGPAVVLGSNYRIYVGTNVEIIGPAEAWFWNNQLHRLGGPAIIEKLDGCRYFVRGEEISEEMFFEIPEMASWELATLLDSPNRAERYLAQLRYAELDIEQVS